MLCSCRWKECDFNFLHIKCGSVLNFEIPLLFLFIARRLTYLSFLFIVSRSVAFLRRPNEKCCVLLANHWPSHSMCTWYNLFFHYFLQLTIFFSCVILFGVELFPVCCCFFFFAWICVIVSIWICVCVLSMACKFVRSLRWLPFVFGVVRLWSERFTTELVDNLCFFHIWSDLWANN